MRTQRVKIYKFDELSEQAKKEAIKQFWDTNVDRGWWQFIYEDSEHIGLKITEFDVDKNSCNGELLEYAHIVAEKIKTEHGDQTGTYNTAVKYLEDLAKLMELHKEDTETYDNEVENLAESFKKSLLKNYLKILSDEYNYLTSEAAIIESIRSGEYEFTANGKQWIS